MATTLVNPSTLSVTELKICCNVYRSARAANSLLSVKYPDEEIVLNPPSPDWDGITLGNLKNIGGPAVVMLARDQGLTPSEDSEDSELARVHNLNMILRHLGVSCARLHLLVLNLKPTNDEPVFKVQYQAVPSWNGILLTSVSRKL